MGGTFDPIHLGHLKAAENARQALGLERVLFIPAGQPPHRRLPEASPLDRYAMVCLATAGQTAFVPSDVEILRAGPSYSVDTVNGLMAARPDAEITIIFGSDASSEITTWHEPARLLLLCRVAVVARPGCAPVPDQILGRRVERVPSSGSEVSATAVRSRVAGGLSLSDWVPAVVAEYIDKRGLYR